MGILLRHEFFDEDSRTLCVVRYDAVTGSARTVQIQREAQASRMLTYKRDSLDIPPHYNDYETILEDVVRTIKAENPMVLLPGGDG